MKFSKRIFTCACMAGLSFSMLGQTAEPSNEPLESTNAQAQPATTPVFAVLSNLGLNSGDPQNPSFPGILAQGRDGNIYSTTTQGGSDSSGTVFKITPSGVRTLLHSFDTTHGSSPFSGLTLGTDGNFYGSANSGGTNSDGVVFKVTSSGSLTVLHNFTGGSDGAEPWAGPVQGSDGNFYGTNISGASSFGVVYKVTSGGSFTTTHDITVRFTEITAPLIQGTDGNFYGTDAEGGTNDEGTVFTVSPSGSFKTLFNFDGTHGFSPFGPLVQSTDGNFYGMTNSGGSGGEGVIFKITPSGTLTVLHNFDSTNGGSPLGGLVRASDGNFYGMTSSGGTSNAGVIFKVTSSGTYSVLHDFDGTHGQDPEVTLLQHTNGKLYGDTKQGGTAGKGVVFSFDVGASAFARLLSSSGTVGSTIEILGQGFTSSTTVSFGGKAGTVASESASFLTAKVPAGALTGAATVKTGSTTLTSNVTFRVLPTIKSFSPTSGPFGKEIVIT